MHRIQKILNDFIDRKKGIKRSDGKEWYQRNVLHTAMEVGEIKIKHWTKDRTIDRGKLLEEYADACHFIMSAAIDAGWMEEVSQNPPEKECLPAGGDDGINPLKCSHTPTRGTPPSTWKQ